MLVLENLPVDHVYISSLLGQSVDDLITMSHHAITSHVLDAFLISPKVAAKWKRKLLLAFDGRYLDLVCDKFGSRVGDTIWDRAADGFMKVHHVCFVTTRCSH
jgi:nucleolar protein 9